MARPGNTQTDTVCPFLKQQLCLQWFRRVTGKSASTCIIQFSSAEELLSCSTDFVLCVSDDMQILWTVTEGLNYADIKTKCFCVLSLGTHMYETSCAGFSAQRCQMVIKHTQFIWIKGETMTQNLRLFQNCYSFVSLKILQFPLKGYSSQSGSFVWVYVLVFFPVFGLFLYLPVLSANSPSVSFFFCPAHAHLSPVVIRPGVSTASISPFIDL